MVGAANHEDTVVILNAIYFVEEVASDFIVDDAVQVFEDEIAGRKLTRLVEDVAESPLWPHPLYLVSTRPQIRMARVLR